MFKERSGAEICKGTVVVGAMVTDVRIRVPEVVRKRELLRGEAESGWRSKLIEVKVTDSDEESMMKMGWGEESEVMVETDL